jgi:RimJ/RimL family protein N-acetyltransferase
MDAPTIRTARLALRACRPGDLDAQAAMWADPRVFAHIGGQARPRADVWLRLLAIPGHWAWFGFGYWTIEDAQGRFVGNAGFANFERPLDPPLDAPEAGWALAPDHWGRGLASEVVAALVAWADARGWPRTQAIIDAGNVASIRVAAKAGFALAHAADYAGAPTQVFARLAGSRGAA